jgi:hypothetical protein
MNPLAGAVLAGQADSGTSSLFSDGRSASARSLVRNFSASRIAARSELSLPGFSIGTVPTTMIRCR